MTTYATAVEVWGSVDKTSFGGGRREPVRTMHAVEWPDPAGLDWWRVETVCGKSTRDDHLNRLGRDTVDEWPPEDMSSDDVCGNCKRVLG